jgi:hypothetical protein
MKLALRENQSTAQVVDVIGTVNKYTNPQSTAGSVGAGAAKGAALGATLGTIFPGLGNAVGAGVGAAIGGIYAGAGQQANKNKQAGINQIIADAQKLIGQPLVKLTDTQLIGWGLAFNGEKKDIPNKLGAGTIAPTVAARYEAAYKLILDEIKAEAGRRGYSKGAGIPAGRNPNTDTGETPTTGKAPAANAIVEDGQTKPAFSFAGVGGIATIGLIGALAFMLFKKR